MKLKHFALPIVLVVVVLLGAGLLVQRFAAPATATSYTGPENMKVAEGKNHGPRFREVQVLTELPPVPTSQNPYTWEFSHKDLSQIQLGADGKYLSRYADFDARTKWPDILPVEFQPEKFMDFGKDPGLGLKDLHKQGITGKGVQVAILDQTLLNEHKEYAGRIVKYVELGTVASQPEMHGAAVASILAGKNVGVAPEAEITYYAIQIVKDWNAKPMSRTFLYMAAAIHRILDDNQKLPADKRIRVISASIGADKNEEGYAEVTAAYERAKREGVLVVSTDMDRRYQYAVHGLGRDPLRNPNDVTAYEPGAFWADRYYQSGQLAPVDVYAPMDSRTTASET
ncbi:MAG TPA: S8 family serine peptidase, partial [Symbiobacteriaceae bacterium]|nr:S8 family serine peptidase [Symbiobacteriaceae bacterium]